MTRTSENLLRKPLSKAGLKRLARQINREMADKDVVFLGILNGAFLFAADLFRCIEFPAKISFVNYASYSGNQFLGNNQRAYRME